MNSRFLIILLVVCTSIYGCLPTGYIDYDKPTISNQENLNELIGKQKLLTIEKFDYPDEVLMKHDSIYYLYTGKGKGIAFFLLIPVHPVAGRGYCLLLGFDERDVLINYYLQVSESPGRSTNCDEMIHEHDLTPPSEGILLHEAKLGNAEAMYSLYKKIKETRQTSEFSWLCKSADKGYYKAQWEVGYIHYYGINGAKKDLVLSLVWYNLASTGRRITVDLQSIRNELTSEQLAMADELIENWKPGLCAQHLLAD